MVRMRLSAAAAPLAAELIGSDVVFAGVGTDSRTLPPGALFVALTGERHDGHDFIMAAAASGAVAALVSRDTVARLPLLRVADTRLALTRLAATWRARFQLPLIAVTGSNGKTTVKEMIARILGQAGPVLATEGNLNNELGVPLMLLRVGPEHRFAVIEMGANHPGEIGHLTRLAEPTVALITNAGPAHLEGFGDIEGVAHAKGEIFQGLQARGTAVINADDPYQALWRELACGRRVLTFGLANSADVTATRVDVGPPHTRLHLETPAGSCALVLSVLGRHNVMNALAAAACALALGLPLDAVRQGLEQVRAVRGRLQVQRGVRGVQLIDDTYNANPASLAGGLQALSAFSGERVLVLGDMAELGPGARLWHTEAGRAAREMGIHRLFALGEHGADVAMGFGSGALHFKEREALIQVLRDVVHDDMTVLIKGSRRMQMEQVVEALVDEPAAVSAASGG
jgi:UDP-N-acetylmuramoyl-tripeptide--D-alanyl-D-alanine ligase